MLEIVESVYRFDGDEDAWLRRVVEAMRSSLDSGHGLLGYTFDLASSSGMRVGRVVDLSSSSSGRDAMASLARLDPAALTRLFGAGFTCGTLSQLLGPAFEGAAASLRPHGIADAVGFSVRDVTGRGCAITAALPRRMRISHRALASWSKLGAHVVAGHRIHGELQRLRAAGRHDRPEAILAPSGKVEHAEPAAQSRQARATLRAAARDIDRARAEAGRTDPARALELWRGLVAGRWSLVDQFDSDGRRFLVARRNDPRVPPHGGLTLAERQAAALASLGHANKSIAYALGIAPSSVAGRLRRAAAKLGVASRIELIELWAALAGGDAHEPA